MTDKKKFKLYSSPKGTLVYPRLVTPDTKFRVEGQFSTKLRLVGADAATFAELVDKMHRAAFEEEKAKLLASDDPKKKARAKNLSLGKPPYEAEVDEDGNETGALIFKFSRTASGISKKTGKKWTVKIRLFDAAGNPVFGVEPFGGTVARVGFFFSPYLVMASNQAGVSLRLDAVKIIDLVMKGERSADDYGFGEKEEGFSASDVDVAPPSPVGSDDAGSSDDDDDEEAESGEAF